MLFDNCKINLILLITAILALNGCSNGLKPDKTSQAVKLQTIEVLATPESGKTYMYEPVQSLVLTMSKNFEQTNTSQNFESFTNVSPLNSCVPDSAKSTRSIITTTKSYGDFHTTIRFQSENESGS